MPLVRAVLDTSVYVSALISANGPAGKVFEAGFRLKVFRPVTSPAMLDELIDVIARPEKMRLIDRTLTELATFHLFVKQNAELLPGDYQDLELAPTDVKDNPVAGGGSRRAGAVPRRPG